MTLPPITRARADRIIANVSGAPEPKRLAPHSSLHAQNLRRSKVLPKSSIYSCRSILRACDAPRIAQILDRDVRLSTKNLSISMCWPCSVQISAVAVVGPGTSPSFVPCSCPRWCSSFLVYLVHPLGADVRQCPSPTETGGASEIFNFSSARDLHFLGSRTIVVSIVTLGKTDVQGWRRTALLRILSSTLLLDSRVTRTGQIVALLSWTLNSIGRSNINRKTVSVF